MKELTLGPSRAWPQAEPTAGRGARGTRRCSEGGRFRGDSAAACSWITRSRGRQRSLAPGHPGRVTALHSCCPAADSGDRQRERK